MFLPNKGTAFRFIAKASKGPSHKIIGWSQFIKNSKGIISLEVSGFLYFNFELLNDLDVK